MRVGLRRLRAVLSIFKSVLRQGEFEGLKRELVWFTEQLGAAREYAVLGESQRKLAGEARTTPECESMLDEVLDRRLQEGLSVARGAVEGARFDRLIISAAVAFISRVDEGDTGVRPVRELARESLEQRRRRVLRRLLHFERLDVRERHRLRIRVKKLRYGSEFFATLFPGGKHTGKRFTHALAALQDTLGKLNDIAVQRRIARELVEHDRLEGAAGRCLAYAAGALGESQREVEGALLASVAKLRERLEKAPRYWR